MTEKEKDRPRLDVLLVQRGFFDSRARAQAAVMAGEIFVNGKPVDKPGVKTKTDAEIEVRPRGNKYSSRGGLKLEGAIEDLKISFADKIVLDVGASTGGFTDFALKNGAKKIYALDVGYGLIDQKLRNDPRVVVIEKTNIRNAGRELFDEIPQFALVDVSFISLELVLPVLNTFGINEILALVKPQFEVGKKEAGKGKGVIKDEKVRKSAILKIRDFSGALGYQVIGEVDSKVKGPKGNLETFLYMAKH